MELLIAIMVGIMIATGTYLMLARNVLRFIFGLILATLLMLPTGLLIGRYAYKTIITVPKAMLVPTVAFMTIIGTYAIRNSVSDVIIMIVLGVFAWILNRAGYSPSPIVLGLILGTIAEQGFVQAWTIGSATEDLMGMFFGRPISIAIVLFIVFTLCYPMLKAYLVKRREKSHVA